MANTPVHKEQLSRARYTAPEAIGYGAQIKKLERYDDQFQQKMAPFHAASTGRVQNKCPADVKDKTQNPLGREEASSCHVILVKEQQLDSTTKPDVKPKEKSCHNPCINSCCNGTYLTGTTSTQSTKSFLLMGQYNDEIQT